MTLPGGIPVPSALPAQALLVCAAFLMAGIAAVDDYGASWDGETQRWVIANANIEFMRGNADALPKDHNRFYGIAFELPLMLLERAAGLTDTRDIYLTRHLLSHVFFLLGGFCCSLLVYRLYDSRRLALIALLLFLLHPRMYAASFFNSKDLPFLGMFMIALCLTHRAFRKDTVGAFLLCGVGVGILVNLRIMGIMAFPAILAMRGLDLALCTERTRRHILATMGAFAVAAPCTLYAISPYLWADPFEFFTAVRTLAHHPTNPREMFQGSLVRASGLPPHFLPTWIAISTPPMELLFGATGAVAVCVLCVLRPRQALGNTDLRFALLLLACLALPVLAAVVLRSHLYDSWRHMFFLHAPLCLLAVFGLHWAGNLARHPAAVQALMGIGLAVTAGEMVRIHPHQNAYFNFLVDRTTPEQLRTEYEMDPRMDACREGLVVLLERYPGRTLHVRDTYPVRKGWFTLPETDRSRLVLVPRQEADFRIACGKQLHSLKTASAGEAVHTRKLYGNTILVVTATRR